MTEVVQRSARKSLVIDLKECMMLKVFLGLDWVTMWMLAMGFGQPKSRNPCDKNAKLGCLRENSALILSAIG